MSFIKLLKLFEKKGKPDDKVIRWITFVILRSGIGLGIGLILGLFGLQQQIVTHKKAHLVFQLLLLLQPF